jgi:small-conductance mechanosensitive channel
MDIALSAAVSGVILAAAVGWMVWHVRVWRRAQADAVEPRELDFRRRQFRRRMQTSAMLAVLAAAIFAGCFVTAPHWAGWYWAAVLLVALWVLLLAMVDALATRMHYLGLRDQYVVEEAKLKAALRRSQAARKNGPPP